MSVLATTLTILFLPAQFFFAGAFLKPQSQPTATTEKVEGASDSKDENSITSFSGAIDGQGKNETALGES
ncbi:MAG: hypothetical protein WC726_04555, partial [Parcubacteria group bacterium]